MSFSGSSMGRFIYLNDKGKFQVDENTSKQFEAMRGGIVIVCVAGNYRTGKSFLLNCLHGSNVKSPDGNGRRHSGFEVGGSTNACTRGIWARWRENQKEKCRDGSLCNVVYLDTEGLAAVDQNQTHDTQIFALSVLLSSCFVYNTMGTINESALDTLALVTHLAAKIYRSRATTSTSSATKTATASASAGENSMLEFPHFMWVVRDFSLALKDESGNQIDSDQYLENSLREKADASNQSVVAKNQIRTVFKDMFPNRACQTLVRPCTEEEHLQSLFSLDSPNIRSQFSEGITRIKNWLGDRSRPKSVGRTVLSGRMFVELARQYVNAINNGAIPNIATALDNAIATQAAVAYEASIKKYHEARIQFINTESQPKNTNLDTSRIVYPIESELLVHAHTHATAAALAEWMSLMEDSANIPLFEKLKNEFIRFFAEAEETNRSQSTITCRAIADKAIAKLSEREYSTATELIKSSTATFQNYLNEAKGPQLLAVLRENLIPQLSQNLTTRCESIDQNSSRAQDELRHKLEVSKTTLEAKATELLGIARERDRAQQNLDRISSERSELQADLKSAQKSIRERESELEASRATVSQHEASRLQLEKKFKESERTAAVLEQQLNQALQDVGQSKHDSRIELELQTTLAQTSVRECDRLKSQISKKDTEIASLNSRLEGLTHTQEIHETLISNLKLGKETLQKDVDASRATLNKALEGSSGSKVQIDELQGEIQKLQQESAEMRIQNQKQASEIKTLRNRHVQTETNQSDQVSMIKAQLAQAESDLEASQTKASQARRDADDYKAKLRKIENRTNEKEQTLSDELEETQQKVRSLQKALELQKQQEQQQLRELEQRLQQEFEKQKLDLHLQFQQEQYQQKQRQKQFQKDIRIPEHSDNNDDMMTSSPAREEPSLSSFPQQQKSKIPASASRSSRLQTESSTTTTTTTKVPEARSSATAAISMAKKPVSNIAQKNVDEHSDDDDESTSFDSDNDNSQQQKKARSTQKKSFRPKRQQKQQQQADPEILDDSKDDSDDVSKSYASRSDLRRLLQETSLTLSAKKQSPAKSVADVATPASSKSTKRVRETETQPQMHVIDDGDDPRDSKRQKTSRVSDASDASDASSVLLKEIKLSPITDGRRGRLSSARFVPPTPRDLSENELKAMTVQELKSLLTERNVQFPQNTKLKKEDFIKLYFEHTAKNAK